MHLMLAGSLSSTKGVPLDGDITELISFWDAGTEVNEAPGEGADQAPRQSGPNSGDDEMGAIRLVDDGFTYPENVLRVTISTMK